MSDDLPFVNEDGAITDLDAFMEWQAEHIRVVAVDPDGTEHEATVIFISGNSTTWAADGSVTSSHWWKGPTGLRESVTEVLRPRRRRWWKR